MRKSMKPSSPVILSKKETTSFINMKRFNGLYGRIAGYVHTARRNILRTVDTEMIKAYWLIGRDIFQEEQQGKQRAEYGKNVLKLLSKGLNKEFGSGFSVDTLERARKFYFIYSLEQKAAKKKSATLLRKSRIPSFKP